MQFKHPEILYLLGLLILPILVHLFQLQRYVKVPFTNVAFLKKLVLQTRKSSQLKKWLILATRLLLFTGLIIAFAQPYFSNYKIEEEQNYFIYLDNSLSLTAKGNKGELLAIATQEIVENLNKNANYSFLTNTNYYKNISADKLKEVLLQTKPSGIKSSIENSILKIKSLSLQNQQNIIISDFQNCTKDNFNQLTANTALIQVLPELKSNICIDSVAVNKDSSVNFNIDVLISNTDTAKENIPISIYNDDKLINKQTFSIKENETTRVSFSVQKSASFLGKIVLQANDTYSFDNVFYFTIDNSKKTNVLAIGNDNNFLERIYNNNEFNFKSSSIKSINYNSINKQQLIVLNELENIPNGLTTTLTDFASKGGNIIMIPSTSPNLDSYNSLLKNLKAGNINSIKKDTLKITNINYQHPIFKDVFEKKVTNFQYPTTFTYAECNLKNSSTLVSFENKKSFIEQASLSTSNLFFVSSPLNKTVTNFTNSPLIVPIFYNIGMISLQHPKMFYRIDTNNNIDITKHLNKDDVLAIKNNENSFIPLQQIFQNKVTINTKELPTKNGFYTVNYNEDIIKHLAYNYSKEESNTTYLNVDDFKEATNNITVSRYISSTLEKINNKSKVQWLWKWFLALAIVSLLLEILILKFFKP